MRRTASIVTRAGALLAMAAATMASTAGAQDGALARRIADAPAGDVRLEYATRDGTCGDGRGMVGMGRMFHGSNVEGMGTWHNDNCVPGDARVTIVRRDGLVTEVRTAIGGHWSSQATGTLLGRVSAPEAASYFLSLAEGAENRAGRSALWAAAIADSAPVARRFLALGMKDGVSWNTRRTAMQLAGATGDATIVPELERIARSGAGDDGTRRKKDEGNVANAAAAALSVIPQDAGIDALVRLATDAPSPGVRKTAVFHAANTGDPRGVRIARTIAEDTKEDEDLRNQAIFALLNRNDAGGEERAWARTLFGRVTSEKLRDPILMGLSQNGSADDRKWVLGLASNEQLPVHTRRQAVFWAGQGGVPIAALLGTYRSLSSGEVKEHVIFALSQREGEAATDALVDIARKDADRDMRRKALFWLGQRKDARAVQVLTEIINQP
jgi:HEAT repeat protein